MKQLRRLARNADGAQVIDTINEIAQVTQREVGQVKLPASWKFELDAGKTLMLLSVKASGGAGTLYLYGTEADRDAPGTGAAQASVALTDGVAKWAYGQVVSNLDPAPSARVYGEVLGATTGSVLEFLYIVVEP